MKLFDKCKLIMAVNYGLLDVFCWIGSAFTVLAEAGLPNDELLI